MNSKNDLESDENIKKISTSEKIEAIQPYRQTHIKKEYFLHTSINL